MVTLVVHFCKVPLQTICAFAAVLARSNDRFILRFSLTKVTPTATESRGFTLG